MTAYYNASSVRQNSAVIHAARPGANRTVCSIPIKTASDVPWQPGGSWCCATCTKLIDGRAPRIAASALSETPDPKQP